MTQEELINVFKYIVKKCDMLINGDDYKADDYTQDNVEDIAELCNHILDGDYGKLAEVKEVDLEEEINRWQGCEAFPEGVNITSLPKAMDIVKRTAKYFFELGLKAQKEESTMTKEEKDLCPMTQEEYEIVKIIIPEADIVYEIGHNNVCEIYESFKQVSNDNIKNIYVVEFKKENELGYVEISADVKGIIVYKINKI